MSSSLDQGHDSFLDIVANLVGILIILVVVVGAQAASQPAVVPDQQVIQQVAFVEEALEKKQVAIAKLENDRHQQETQLLEESRLAANLAEQRHEMLMQMAVIEKEMARRRAQREKDLKEKLDRVDAKKRANIEKQHAFESKQDDLRERLASLQKELNAVSATLSPTPPKVIRHLPSPIAKTVFSDEIHFLLSGGKLTFVPMDELVDRMKSEWKVKAEKLKSTFRTVETAGPVGDFRIQYELFRTTEKQKTRVGIVERERVQFKHFQLIPTSSGHGVPMANVFQERSPLVAGLRGRDPQRTTVSLWVYPDSFDEHNQMKSWLHERGFQVASWPMNFGKRISGGPNGFKTSAQ